jgi:uroporphyrinogen decarboxylase
MNSRERFMTALRGDVSDRVPLFEFYWGLPFIKSILGDITSPYHNADDEVRMSRAMGIDMVYTAPYGFTSFTNIQLHGKEYQDEWGMTWGSSNESWPGSWPIEHAIDNYEEWKDLTIPNPYLVKRMEQPRRTVELAKDELAIVGGVRGPFSAASILCGMVNLCMWLYDNPAFAHHLIQTMSEWNTKIGIQLIETGVDAIIIHDDWGMNDSTFIHPEQWAKFVKPYITEQINTFSDMGVAVILHSDGNLNNILDEIVDLKISALNPLQRNANMNITKIKEKYGDRLCLIGNISTTTTLSQGNPNDVELEVLECLRDAAPGGGYIMAPDHSFHSGIPNENIRMVIDTCYKYGKYPINLEMISIRIDELKNNRDKIKQGKM